MLKSWISIMKDIVCILMYQNVVNSCLQRIHMSCGLSVKRKSHLLQKRSEVRDGNDYCEGLRVCTAEISTFLCAYILMTRGRPLCMNVFLSMWHSDPFTLVIASPSFICMCVLPTVWPCATINGAEQEAFRIAFYNNVYEKILKRAWCYEISKTSSERDFLSSILGFFCLPWVSSCSSFCGF